MTLTTLSTAHAELEIIDLNKGNGFATIQLEESSIIKRYNTILHIINLTEYKRNIEIMERNIKRLPEENSSLERKMQKIRNEFQILLPHPTVNRQKRGLFNIVGTGLQFLFGTMDDRDRQDIEEHLKIIETNDHNEILNLNKQIIINDKFNKQIKILTDTLNNETKEIIKKIDNFIGTYDYEKDIAKIQYEIKLRENLEYLHEDIEKIKEVIMTSRLGVLSRDILTTEEIEHHNIQLNNLEDIQLSLALYKNNIIFVIKLPVFTNETYQKLYIQPIPNKYNNMQLKINKHLYLTNNQIMYEDTKYLKKLKEIKDNCIENLFNKHMHCNFIKNENEKILEIGNNNLILINVKQQELNQTCNKQRIFVKGNYLLKFQNCQIRINNEIYEKNNYKYEPIIPNTILNINFTKIEDLSFKELHYENINNLKEIEELKYNYKKSNLTIYLIIVIIVTTLIIYVCIKIKNYKRKINNVNLPTVSFQPLEESKGGGVISEHTCASP